MDIFISYNSHDQDVADKIFATLNDRRLSCWYAPMIQYGHYAEQITNEINQCKVFIVLVDKFSAQSKHVNTEVELAFNRYKNNELMIIPIRLDSEPLSGSFEYYFANIQWIDAYSVPINVAISTLLSRVEAALSLQFTNPADKYISDDSFYDDFSEGKRLANHREIMNPIEDQCLDKLISGKSDLVCLILGGVTATDFLRFVLRKEIARFVCLSDSDRGVRGATMLMKQIYQTTGKFCHFYTVNFDSDLETQLNNCLLDIFSTEDVLCRFDVVVCDGVLTQCNDPLKVLQCIKKHLADKAVAIFNEIDDGALFAAPDKRKVWENYFYYYKYNVSRGGRQTGRLVHSLLHQIGAKDIRLEKYGISSAGMSTEDRYKLFDVTTSFMQWDMNIALRESNSNIPYAVEFLDYCAEHYEEMLQNVADDGFVFNSYHVIYSVKF